VIVVAADAGACECVQSAAAVVPERAETGERDVHPLAVCDAKGKEPLEAARALAKAQKWEAALSCAAQASALAPDDPLAHAERGRALVALGHDDDAKLAYARALALDPESIPALLGAAQLYAVALPSSREHDELGVLYAERGFELALLPAGELSSVGALAVDPSAGAIAVELARVAAIALNDVGRNAEAIEKAEWVLDRIKGDPEAAFERAIGLFERCQFPEARAAFERLVLNKQRSAHAHYHLGLLLEREGKQVEADRHFARALRAAPEHFWAPVILPEAEFEKELEALVAGLPADVKKDLSGVPVTAEDLPALADLTSGVPPLSPTILGLFRGPPLQESCTEDDGSPCRSVVLYRKNLGRAVRSRDELLTQMRVTLLHEIGHLRGEDDGELAARGLE
jgi:tetratricopeptide (TPR) repeat protein